MSGGFGFDPVGCVNLERMEDDDNVFTLDHANLTYFNDSDEDDQILSAESIPESIGPANSAGYHAPGNVAVEFNNLCCSDYQPLESISQEYVRSSGESYGVEECCTGVSSDDVFEESEEDRRIRVEVEEIFQILRAEEGIVTGEYDSQAGLGENDQGMENLLSSPVLDQDLRNIRSSSYTSPDLFDCYSSENYNSIDNSGQFIEEGNFTSQDERMQLREEEFVQVSDEDVEVDVDEIIQVSDDEIIQVSDNEIIQASDDEIIQVSDEIIEASDNEMFTVDQEEIFRAVNEQVVGGSKTPKVQQIEHDFYEELRNLPSSGSVSPNIFPEYQYISDSDSTDFSENEEVSDMKNDENVEGLMSEVREVQETQFVGVKDRETACRSRSTSPSMLENFSPDLFADDNDGCDSPEDGDLTDFSEGDTEANEVVASNARSRKTSPSMFDDSDIFPTHSGEEFGDSGRESDEAASERWLPGSWLYPQIRHSPVSYEEEDCEAVPECSRTPEKYFTQRNSHEYAQASQESLFESSQDWPMNISQDSLFGISQSWAETSQESFHNSLEEFWETSPDSLLQTSQESTDLSQEFVNLSTADVELLECVQSNLKYICDGYDLFIPDILQHNPNETEIFLLEKMMKYARTTLLELSTGCFPSIWCVSTRKQRDGKKVKKFSTICFSRTRSRNKYTVMVSILAKACKMFREGKTATLRDIYYENPTLFGDQKRVVSAIKELASYFQVTPSVFPFVPSHKGIMAAGSNLQLQRELRGHSHKLQKMTIEETGTLIPGLRTIKSWGKFHSNAKFILIVEKEAIFHRLLEEHVIAKYPTFILLTGKGYPDNGTAAMAHKLTHDLEIPAFILVDGDPYGLEIAVVYKWGSCSHMEKFPQENEILAVPQIILLGIRPSEIPSLRFPQNIRIPLSSRDYSKLNSLLVRLSGYDDLEWFAEVSQLKQLEYKVEIEAVTSDEDPNYLCEDFLYNKIVSFL